jgi:cation:H+ antiporter
VSVAFLANLGILGAPMTTLTQDLADVGPTRQIVALSLAVAVTVPGLVLRATEPHLAHHWEALVFGLAIVGAAFLLSWAAEVAQLDVSAGLAIAVLALIAVLPEYAVDLVFAFKAGNAVQAFGEACKAPLSAAESPCSLALANMTGANRLLIGIGWPMVVLIGWYRSRRAGKRLRAVGLERSRSVELAFLTVATLYSLTLPFKTSITLWDAAVLVGIFVVYTIRLATAPSEEPHLVGPARYIGTFRTGQRRAAIVAMLVFAALVILGVAEHFAEALVATGQTLEISEFLLVQWLAPLASEAPELLVAGLYAWRLNTSTGLGCLVSSKVNQWTLLVGTLPLVFALASESLEGLPVEPRQRKELLLTAAQSVFAVATLSSLSLSTRGAFALFGLFWTQFILSALVPDAGNGAELVSVSVLYLVVGSMILLRDRRAVPMLLRDGFQTPHAALRK